MTFQEAYKILFELGKSYGFRPDFPEGMEQYLSAVIAPIENDSTSSDGLRQEVERSFTSYESRPRWLQEPNWPFSRGQPMIFVGQLDRRIDGMNVSFYVFKDQSLGVTKVITQVLAIVPAG